MFAAALCILPLGACSGSDDGGGGGDVVAPAANPGRSSTIALTSDDARLLVVNRQNDSVSILRVKDDSGADVEVLLAELSVGQEPRFVAVSPDDQLALVTNAGDGTVSVIDLTTNSVQGVIPVGTEPRGVAFTPNGTYAYVANHTSGDVTVIRTSTNLVVNTVATGGNPMALAISDDGDSDDLDETVFVTRFFSEVIDPINRPDGFNDSKEGLVDYFGVGSSLSQPTPISIHRLSPLADSGFTADRRPFCPDTRTGLEAAGTVFFSSGPDNTPGTGDTAVGGDQGAALLANETFCPDPLASDISDGGPTANVLQGVYPNYLYGALIRNGVLFVPNVGASPEPPVRFNLNVQALISSVDLASGAESSINLNNQIKAEVQPDEADANSTLQRVFGNDVVAMDSNSEGTEFYIVSRGGNYVMRATLDNGQLSIGAPSVERFQTGNLPSGIAVSRDGRRAYTNNEVSTSVTSMDLVSNVVLNRDIESSAPPVPGTQKHRNVLGKLAFFTALGIPDDLDTTGNGSFDIPVRDIVPLAHRGKASDNGWSSCSSCHDDGHSDNVTWIFPTGPRQTLPLEGTFDSSNSADQRILNWNAVRGSVTDFNNNSRGVQGGGGFAQAVDIGGVPTDRTGEVFNHGPTTGISDALDAMTEWVANSVDSPAMPEGDLLSVAAGRTQFEANCASCHGGNKWTKSSVTLYTNNPTFNENPLGLNFFAGVAPIDPMLNVGGPQIVSIGAVQFLEDVGTLDTTRALEIRGAGAIAGQSTQGFPPLGGAGFNVPSLLGVAYHAPYLHDGSATTLEEVFAVHEIGGQAIDQAISDPQDLADLRAFLLSIDEDTTPFL